MWFSEGEHSEQWVRLHTYQHVCLSCCLQVSAGENSSHLCTVNTADSRISTWRKLKVFDILNSICSPFTVGGWFSWNFTKSLAWSTEPSSTNACMVHNKLISDNTSLSCMYVVYIHNLQDIYCFCLHFKLQPISFSPALYTRQQSFYFHPYEVFFSF